MVYYELICCIFSQLQKFVFHSDLHGARQHATVGLRTNGTVYYEMR